MRTRHRACLGTLTAGLLLVAAACGSGDSNEAASSSSPSPSVQSRAVLDGPLSRCPGQPPAAAEAGFEALTLSDPDVGELPAFRVGEGRTVAILLHQTNGNGLCGWLPFARLLAERDGVAALGFDACNYGGAECVKVDDGTFTPADQIDAVQVAIDFARTEMDAERVVVVGASMGGSVAMMSAAELDGIDSAVNLSGPVDWEGTEVIREGSAIRVPVLVAMANDEGEEEVEGTKQIAENAPEGSRFLEAKVGHGYALVTDIYGEPVHLAEDVIDWVAGG